MSAAEFLALQGRAAELT